jgi:hypothetical protein
MMSGGADGPDVDQDYDAGPQTKWNRFTQQRLKAWQPVLAPKWVISIYIVCGAVFTGLGIVMLLTSWGVVEFHYEYTNTPVSEATGTGYFDIEVDKDLEPPIWLYYQLDGFHQNHRRYIRSIANAQMQATLPPEIDPTKLGACRPWVTTGERVNYPCGLIAKSVFNDSFIVTVKAPSEEAYRIVDVDSSAKTIAWASDTEGKFQNLDPEAKPLAGVENQVHMNMWINQRFPPVECVQTTISEAKPWVPVYVGTREETKQGASSAEEDKKVEVVDCKGYPTAAKKSQSGGVGGSPVCNFKRLGKSFTCDGDYAIKPVHDWGIENGHFIVWMRIAGLPSFRKVWGKVNVAVKAGSRIRVHFSDNFPVREFYGQKAFVLSTTSVLGGRNDFLGYGYLVVGCACLIFGALFLWRHIVKPRPLGDISLLAIQR